MEWTRGRSTERLLFARHTCQRLLAEQPNDRQLHFGLGDSARHAREFIARLAHFGSPKLAADSMGKNVSGVAALVILLFVVYLSSDRSIPDQPICSTISVDQAQTAVLEGRIRGITPAALAAILVHARRQAA